MEAVLLRKVSRDALMLFRVMCVGMPAAMALLNWIAVGNVKRPCQWRWVVWGVDKVADALHQYDKKSEGPLGRGVKDCQQQSLAHRCRCMTADA